MAKMRVELIAKTEGDLDLLVVNMARQSFGKERDTFNPAKDVGLLNYLATGMRTGEREALIDDMLAAGGSRNDLSRIIDRIQRIKKHFVPFCHPQITLRLYVPFFLARQIDRSVIGQHTSDYPYEEAMSEESRRYVDDTPEVFEFEQWRMRPKDAKQGSGERVSDPFWPDTQYNAATNTALGAYHELVHNCEIAPEQARALLPVGTMTTLSKTGSLYYWANLYTQRVDKHAQREVNDFAEMVRTIVQPLAPYSWEALTGY